MHMRNMHYNMYVMYTVIWCVCVLRIMCLTNGKVSQTARTEMFFATGPPLESGFRATPSAENCLPGPLCTPKPSKHPAGLEDCQTGLDKRGSNKMPVRPSYIKNSCSATSEVLALPASEGCQTNPKMGPGPPTQASRTSIGRPAETSLSLLINHYLRSRDQQSRTEVPSNCSMLYTHTYIHTAYIYIYSTYTYVCIYTYIYIYIERER